MNIPWFYLLLGINDKQLIEQVQSNHTTTPFFTFVIPVAFLTTIPAEAMLRHIQIGWVIGAGILVMGLLIFSRAFWGFVLRFYTSASS